MRFESHSRNEFVSASIDREGLEDTVQGPGDSELISNHDGNGSENVT